MQTFYENRAKDVRIGINHFNRYVLVGDISMLSFQNCIHALKIIMHTALAPESFSYFLILYLAENLS